MVILLMTSDAPNHPNHLILYIFVAFHVAMLGEDRNLIFGTEVDHNKS